MTPVPVFDELRRLADSADVVFRDGADTFAVGNITPQEVGELKNMRRPPYAVQRTLEVVCLLMSCARYALAQRRLSPPSWATVQRLLSHTDIIKRLLDFDVQLLREVPDLTKYVAAEYFGIGTLAASAGAKWAKVETPRRRGGVDLVLGTPRRGCVTPRASQQTTSFLLQQSGTPRASGNYAAAFREPLTFERVYRANRAAAALFRWCASALADASAPEEPVREAFVDLAVKVEPIVCEEITRASPSPVDEEEPVTIPLQRRAPSRKATPEQVPEEPAPVKLPVFARPRKTPPKQAVELKPDRHFLSETLTFEDGNPCITDEHEHLLQNVAAAICMRTSLELRVLTWPARRECKALTKTRTEAVQSFFAMHGVSSTATYNHARKDQAEIICQLLLDGDPTLRDYYLGFRVGAEVAEIVFWLKRHFQACVYGQSMQSIW